MSELKPMICECCGGHIDRTTLICKMCGTAYRLDDNFLPVRIEVRKGDIRVVESCIQLPREYVLCMDADEMSKLTLTKMAEQMAEKILPLIEYQTEFDMRQNMYVTHGRLRVVDPHWH